MAYDWYHREAEKTLQRLLPRLDLDADDKQIFSSRAQVHFPRLFRLLHQLYGEQYDFFYHIEQIMLTAAQMFAIRPPDLKTLDQQRADEKLWFRSERMVGGVCYVDLLAGDLAGLHEKIPYFQELGLTYLHLMPLFASPPDNSDGGYAISDYRRVNPRLGTMAELAGLARALRKAGISLVLDFVFNHTSDQHHWAQRALAGDEAYQDYYFMFSDRTMPDAYEHTLREIFPEQAPGNFTYQSEIDKWAWTTFYDFQWDLNYQNPAVFNAMLGEMLFLANQGVEFLRLDAVAFIWKRLGTACENLPEAHTIIQAFNALVQIVAPAMLFKSEAIVHPNDVATYISWNEAPLSYNPTLMALLWESLATREVRLLQHSMSKRFWVQDDCAWVNYVRVHDDIGWTFADEDAAELWINGYDHRQFLNHFYIGEFPGSFAKGVGFGFNPKNRDMRIAGTGASLVGIEQALNADDDRLLDMAVRRWILIHSVIMSAGGIPLIYLGDEIAMLNDYTYIHDEHKRDDARWVHRPAFDWARAAERDKPATVIGRVFQALRRLIAIRKRTPALGQTASTFFATGNVHVLGYVRGGQLLVLANFSEREQTVDSAMLTAYAPIERATHDLITDAPVQLAETITLEPYQFMWALLADASE
jgi:amylosucrase